MEGDDPLIYELIRPQTNPHKTNLLVTDADLFPLFQRANINSIETRQVYRTFFFKEELKGRVSDKFTKINCVTLWQRLIIGIKHEEYIYK